MRKWWRLIGGGGVLLLVVGLLFLGLGQVEIRSRHEVFRDFEQRQRDNAVRIKQKLFREPLFEAYILRLLEGIERLECSPASLQTGLDNLRRDFTHPRQSRPLGKFWFRAVRGEGSLIPAGQESPPDIEEKAGALLDWLLTSAAGGTAMAPGQKEMFEGLLGAKVRWQQLRFKPMWMHPVNFQGEGLRSLFWVVLVDRDVIPNPAREEVGNIRRGCRGILMGVLDWLAIDREMQARFLVDLHNSENNSERMWSLNRRTGGGISEYPQPLNCPQILDRVGGDPPRDFTTFIRDNSIYCLIPLFSGLKNWDMEGQDNFLSFLKKSHEYNDFLVIHRDFSVEMKTILVNFVEYRRILLLVALAALVVFLYFEFSSFISLRLKWWGTAAIIFGLPGLIFLFIQWRSIEGLMEREFVAERDRLRQRLAGISREAEGCKAHLLQVVRAFREEMTLDRIVAGLGSEKRGQLQGNNFIDKAMFYNLDGKCVFNYHRSGNETEDQIVAGLIRNILPFLQKNIQNREEKLQAQIAAEFFDLFFSQSALTLLMNLDQLTELNISDKLNTVYLDLIRDGEGEPQYIMVMLLEVHKFLELWIEGRVREAHYPQYRGDLLYFLPGDEERVSPSSHPGCAYSRRQTPGEPCRWPHENHSITIKQNRFLKDRWLEKFSGPLPDDFDRDFLFTAVFSPIMNGLMILAAPRGPIIEEVEREQKLISQRMVLGFLLAILFFGLVTWRILLPIKEVGQAMRAVEAENYEFQLHLDSRDELGELSRTFNKMIGGLAERERLDTENTLLALQEKKRQTEMNVAHEIQNLLFPEEMPRLPGFQFAGKSKAADAVGGDYYDFIELPDGKWAIVIGDVSGHGIPAALLMAMAKSGTILGLTQVLPPGKMLESLNELVYTTMRRKRMMTFFMAQLDGRTHQICFANAGHNFPAIVGGDGEKKYLGSTAYPLGTRKKGEYREVTYDLAPGDVICFYTDGAVEAVNPEGVPFGYDRLRSHLQEGRHLKAGQLLDQIFAAILEFCRGRPFDDDVTLAIVKREGHDGA